MRRLAFTVCWLLAMTATATVAQRPGGRPPGPFDRGGPARTEPPKAAPVPVQGGPDTLVSMSFENADVKAVLKVLGKAANVTVVIDPALEGNVSIMATRDIPVQEAFDIMGSVLRVRGYAILGTVRDKVVQVVPIKQAVTAGVPVLADGETLPEGANETLVTQVVQLKYTDATKVKTDLQPLVSSDQASLVANGDSNMLVITDTRANVRRMMTVIKALDRDLSDVLAVEVVPLKYAYAPAIADMLSALFEEAKAKKVGMPQPGAPPPPPSGGAPPIPKPAAGALVEMKGEVKVQADERTNCIIVWAAKEKIELIRGLIEKLDFDVAPDVTVKVFALKYADPLRVAQELNQIFEQPQGAPEITPRRQMPWEFRVRGERAEQTRRKGYAGLKENQVVPDPRTNSIIVTATEENMKAFETLIEAMDAPTTLSELTRIIRLENAKASELAQTLTNLMRGPRQRTGFLSFLFGERETGGGSLDFFRDVTIVADDKTNSLIISGPQQIFPALEQMITQLDQPVSQVFIEVVITDVTLDKNQELGVEWQIPSPHSANDVFTQDLDVRNRSDVGFRYTLFEGASRALLKTLVEQNKVKVLSTPHITTRDNVQAKIEIGQQYPFVERFETTGVQTVPQFGYKDITISLTVTPHITTGKSITLDLHQTINELQGTIQQGEFTQPIVGKREAQTSVSVEDNQTLIIGGIMRDSETSNVRKVPVLGDLPIVGFMFRDTQKKRQKNELMVFLTPHIVASPADANRITQSQKDKLEPSGKKPKKESSTEQAPEKQAPVGP